MDLIPLIVLIVLVNLIFLSALAAGQMSSGWTMRLSLGAQVVAGLLAIGFGVIAVSGHRPNLLQLISMIGVLLAIPIAIGMVYLEYMLIGRRTRFRRDMRESLWAGRFGPGNWLSWWPR